MMEIEDVTPVFRGGASRSNSGGGTPVTGAAKGTTPKRMASPANVPRPTTLGPPLAIRASSGISNQVFPPIEDRRDYFESLPASYAQSFASADSHGDSMVPYEKALELQATTVEQITQFVIAREREASTAVADANAHATAVHHAATAAADAAKLAESQAKQDAYLTRETAYKACDHAKQMIKNLINEKREQQKDMTEQLAYGHQVASGYKSCYEQESMYAEVYVQQHNEMQYAESSIRAQSIAYIDTAETKHNMEMAERRRTAHATVESLQQELTKSRMANKEQNVTAYAQYQAQFDRLKEEALASERNVMALAETKVKEAQAHSLQLQPQSNDQKALRDELTAMRVEMVKSSFWDGGRAGVARDAGRPRRDKE